MTRTSSASRPGPMTVAIALVLGLVLAGALVLAASPVLHHAAHPDAGNAEHACLATVFVKGNLIQPVAAVPVALLVPFGDAPPAPFVPMGVPVSDLRAHGSRAPPVSDSPPVSS